MFLGAVPTDAPVLVLLVTQPGCGHCEEFMPRFRRVASAYPDLAMMHLDASDQRPEVQDWMDQFHLESTPTVFVLRHAALGGGAWRVEGAVPDAQIAHTLEFARRMRP